MFKQISLKFLMGVPLFLVCYSYGLSDSKASLAEDFSSFEGRRISLIQLQGLKITRDFIVFRELKSKSGAEFQSSLLKADIRSLEKLDIFARIEPVVRLVGDSVAITLNLVEIPLIIVHPTGEYTEENGLSLGVGSISTNLGGLNHFFEASFKTGYLPGSVQRFSFEYRLPRIADLRMTPEIWIADERRDNKLIAMDDVREEYQVARLRLKTIHIHQKNYQIGSQLEGGLEKFSFEDKSILSTPRYDGVTTSGLNVFFDSRNELGNPTQGWFLEAGVLNHGGFTGGDVHFVSTFLDTRLYLLVTERQHFLLSHLTNLQTGTSSGSVPLYKNFWIGGANSVRGYETGPAHHGVNQMLLSAEYRYLLVKPRVIPLYLFNWKIDLGLQPFVGVDYGTTWDDKLGEQAFLLGTAYGLQVLIPYKQMVRFELGVSELGNLSKLHFTFHLATESKPVVARYRRR